jgi:hypothetical protein
MFRSSGLFETLLREPPPPPAGQRGSCGRAAVRHHPDEGLRQITPHDGYRHQDRIVVCELLLHGPFHITTDWMYFRRDHADRVYRSSPRDRCVILDPRRASRLRNPTARLVAEYLWGYVAAIRRAPLSSADRRECYRLLAHWMGDRAVSGVVPRHLEPISEELSAIHRNYADSVSPVVSGQEGRS